MKAVMGISLVTAVLLMGCDDVNKEKRMTSDELSTVCINDVRYLENRTYLGYTVNTPMFNADGTISTCLDEQSMIEYLDDMEYYNQK